MRRRGSRIRIKLQRNVRNLIVTNKMAVDRFTNLSKKEQDKMKEKMLECDFFRKAYQSILSSKKDDQNRAHVMSYEHFILGIMEKMQIKTYERGDFLCHLGEQGNEMFLVYTGNVGVYVPKSNESMEEEREKTKAILKKIYKKTNTIYTPKVLRDKLTFEKIEDILQILYEHENLNEDVLAILSNIGSTKSKIWEHWDNRHLYLLASPIKDKYYSDLVITYFHVANKVSGDIVGELALRDKKPRNATLIALLKTKCLTLDKKTYNEYFEYAIMDQGGKQKFFESCFPNMSRTKLGNFAYMFEEKVHNRGQIIAKKGAFIYKMFIVKEGTVGVFSNEGDDPDAIERMTKVGGRETLSILKEFCLIGEEGFYQKHYNFSFVALSQPVVTYVLEVKNFEQSRKMMGTIMEEIVKLSLKSLKYRKKRKIQLEEFNKQFLKKHHSKFDLYKKTFNNMIKKEKRADEIFLEKKRIKTEETSSDESKIEKIKLRNPIDSDEEPQDPIFHEYKMQFIPLHCRKMVSEVERKMVYDPRKMRKDQIEMLADLYYTGVQRQHFGKISKFEGMSKEEKKKEIEKRIEIDKKRKKLEKYPDYIKRDVTRPIIRVKYFDYKNSNGLITGALTTKPLSRSASPTNTPFKVKKQKVEKSIGIIKEGVESKEEGRQIKRPAPEQKSVPKLKASQRKKESVPPARAKFKILELNFKDNSLQTLPTVKGRLTKSRKRTEKSHPCLFTSKSEIALQTVQSMRTKRLNQRHKNKSYKKIGLIAERKFSNHSSSRISHQSRAKSNDNHLYKGKADPKRFFTPKHNVPFSNSKNYTNTRKYLKNHPMRGPNRFKNPYTPTLPKYNDFFSQRIGKGNSADMNKKSRIIKF